MKKITVNILVAAAIIAALAFLYMDMRNKEQAAIKSFFAGAKRTEGLDLKKAGNEEFIKLNLSQVKRACRVLDASGNRLGTGFIVESDGYRRRIKVAVAIDSNNEKISGIKILRHNETPEYGGYITEDWFINRFSGRSPKSFLNLVALDESTPQDIIQVTGATLSSRGVVDAVNAAICAYQLVESGIAMEKPVFNTLEEKQEEEETFYIRYDGDKSIKMTMEDLKSFPYVKSDCILTKSTGTKINMTAEGPLLDEVLKKHGIDIYDYAGLGIKGRDGYYALVSKDIISNRQIILGNTFNGKAIPEEEKPIRVVIPEEFGVYWVKMVSEIELYDDIPEKNIRSVKMFDAVARDIKPYPFEYYGKKDNSIEVSKILGKFEHVDPKGFFTMASSDGLVKNESIAMVSSKGYYIKIEGEGAPMNVTANFKLGSNVKYIACFSTTADAVIFPQEMIKLAGTAKLAGTEGMPLDKVMEYAGMTGMTEKQYEIVDVEGNRMSIDGDSLKNCILLYEDKKVRALFDNGNETKEIRDVLEISEVRN
jgi:Na+-translocating ferredoxin:NAD+ oxidoreductase RnfG subunit/DMSO/TMAO reductase YedYZ molybdopterin-dependent catalytic subunit